MSAKKKPKVNVESLQKRAQKKLVNASKLLKEAGTLAEKGGFVLRFNGGGQFTPKSFFETSYWEDAALEQLKRDGHTEYSYATHKDQYGREVTDYDKSIETHETYESMSGKRQIEVLKGMAEDFMRDEVPEYASPGWWRASTC